MGWRKKLINMFNSFPMNNYRALRVERKGIEYCIGSTTANVHTLYCTQPKHAKIVGSGWFRYLLDLLAIYRYLYIMTNRRISVDRGWRSSFHLMPMMATRKSWSKWATWGWCSPQVNLRFQNWKILEAKDCYQHLDRWLNKTNCRVSFVLICAKPLNTQRVPPINSGALRNTNILAGASSSCWTRKLHIFCSPMLGLSLKRLRGSVAGECIAGTGIVLRRNSFTAFLRSLFQSFVILTCVIYSNWH